MAIYTSIGELILNVSLFGLGAGFGILGLLFGISRGMTKNADAWPIIFSAFAWLFALMVPSAIWASMIFLAGAIGITFAFTPFFKKVNSSNILIVAFIALMMNAIMLIGFGAYQSALSWDDSYTAAQETLPGVFQLAETSSSADIPDVGLCAPADQAAGRCQDVAKSFSFSAIAFDPIVSFFALPIFLGKLLVLAAMAVLVPLLLSLKIKAMVANPFIGVLIGLYIVAWNFIILYNFIMMLINNRGKT